MKVTRVTHGMERATFPKRTSKLGLTSGKKKFLKKLKRKVEKEASIRKRKSRYMRRVRSERG